MSRQPTPAESDEIGRSIQEIEREWDRERRRQQAENRQIEEARRRQPRVPDTTLPGYGGDTAMQDWT